MINVINEVLTIEGVLQIAVIGLFVGSLLGLVTLSLQSVLDIFKNLIRR